LASASSATDDGPRCRDAGHDASTCSLCAVLAKIKVGRAALYCTDLIVGEV
jgi:hypothetical protein